MSDSMPGWYPDPVTAGQQRYWDGAQWTENVAPLPPGPPPMAPGSIPPPPPPGYASAYPGYGAPSYGVPSYGVPQQGKPYAHWGLRVGATLLDAIITIPIVIIGVVVLISGSTTTTDAYGNTTMTSASGGAVLAFWGFVLVAIAFGLWNQCYRQGRTGYSLGKQVVGIKLIKERTGEPVGGWLAFGRQILHAADQALCYLGYLWPLWDDKKQTFADKIVQSVVVVEPKPKS